VFSKKGKVARDIMRPACDLVTEETGIDEAARLLIGERIRRVPVIRGGKMVGLLSRSDVLDFFAKTRWTCKVCGWWERSLEKPTVAIRARALTSPWSAPIPGTEKTPHEQLSLKAQSFTESVIREMTRLNLELNGAERAVKLRPGFSRLQHRRTHPGRGGDRAARRLQPVRHDMGRPAAAQAVARKQSATWAAMWTQTPKSRFRAVRPKR